MKSSTKFVISITSIAAAICVPTTSALASEYKPTPPTTQAGTGYSLLTKALPTRTYATLTVPSIGIKNLKIVRYTGTPDDGPGTVIQDRGIASAPHGKWGGVQAGQVGNFFLAAHRTSAGGPMRNVPKLKNGQKIYIKRGSTTYVYTVSYRLMINFRSAKSKASQLAPVPGFPSKTAELPAIVLSTCATPEDKAAGLGWKDRYGNPTHRIGIVGFIEKVITTPAVTTLSSSNITNTTATLNGTVIANNDTTTVSYTVGTNADLSNGKVVSAVPSIVSGDKPVSTKAVVDQLLPNTTYYFRVMANNSKGTTYGQILSFTTPA